MPFTPRISNPQQQTVADAIAASKLSDRQKQKLWESIGDEKRLLRTAKMYKDLLPIESAKTIWNNRSSGPWEIGEAEPETPPQQPGFFSQAWDTLSGAASGIGDMFTRAGEGVYLPSHEQTMQRGKGVVEAIAGTPEEPTYIGETVKDIRGNIANPGEIFTPEYWLGGVPSLPPSVRPPTEQETNDAILRMNLRRTPGPTVFQKPFFSAGEWGKPKGKFTGLLEPGNIDLQARPRVYLPDGDLASVRSISIGVDGKEVLIPTISDDGRELSNDEAIDLYESTGKHLGVFDTPEHATVYAEALHIAQADLPQPIGPVQEPPRQPYRPGVPQQGLTGIPGTKTPWETITTPIVRTKKLAPKGTALRGILGETDEFISPGMLAVAGTVPPVVRGATAGLAPIAPSVARWIPLATGAAFGTGMGITAVQYEQAAQAAKAAGDDAAASELRGHAIAAGLGGALAVGAGYLETPKRVSRVSAEPVAETIPMDRQLGASYAPPEPAPTAAAQPQPTPQGPIAALRPAGMELPAPPTEPLTARQKWERRIRGTETGALETTLPERTVGRGKKKTTVPGGRVFMAGEATKPEAQGPPLKVERSDMGKWVDKVKAEEAEFQAREAMVRSQAERALKMMPEMGTMAGRRGITPTRGLLEKPSFKMPPASGIPETTVPRETSEEPLTGEKPILPSDLAKPGQGRPPVYGKVSHSKVGPHKILGSFAVVPNSELVTSHGAYLAENPYYPQQYQNRQRSSKESDIGIEEIRTRLDPEQLGDSYLAKDGAPFILPDKVVLAGNGRSLALRRAYAENEAGAQRYRQWLIDNADRFKLDRSAIESMADPQLVRVYEPANTLDPGEFARIANVDETVQLSPAELASSDASRLTTGILDRFDSEAGAGILAESNRDFTRAFLEKIVQPSELPNFTHEGKINQRGVERVRNAIFAKAYGDPAALEKVTQIPGEDTAVLSQALLRAAPSMVKTQTGIAKGDLFDAPIHKEAARVTGLLANLSERGVDFEHYANQETLFKTGNELTPVETAMGRFMAENSRSPEKIATLLRQYNEALAAAGSPKQTGMFAMNPPTQADLLEAALRRVEAEYGTKASQRRERAARKKTSGADGEGKTGELGAITEQLSAQLARDTEVGERATEVTPRKRRLRDFTISNPTEGQIVEGADAVYQKSRKDKPGTLYLNSAAAGLLRAVIERSGKIATGMRVSRKGVSDMRDGLKRYIKAVDREGAFPDSTVQAAKALYAQLDQAYKENGNVIMVVAGTVGDQPRTIGDLKRTVLHERGHEAMEQLKEKIGQVDLVDIQEFYGVGSGADQSFPQFLAQTAAQNLQRKFKYSASDITDEVLADIYAGDLKRLGLTQSQAEEVFMHFLDLLVKDVGKDAEDLVGMMRPRLREIYETKYAGKTSAEISNIRPESQWLAGPSRFVSRLREGWARSGLEAPTPAKLPAEELREARGGPDGSIDNAGEVLEGLKRFADRISKKKFGREKPSDNFVIPKPIAAPQELFGITASNRSPSSRYANLIPEQVARTIPQTGETVMVPLRENVRTVINKAIQAEQQQAMDTARRDVTIRLAYRQAGKANEVKLGELLNDPDIQDVPSLLAKFPDTPVAVQKSYDSLRRYLDNERAEIAQAMRDAGQDVPADWGVGKGYFPHIFDGDFYMVDKRTGDVIIADPKQGAYYRSPKDVSDAAVRAVEGSGGQLGYDNIEFKMFNHKFTGDPRVRMTRGQYIRFKNGLADLGLDWESINEMMGTTARVTRGQRQAPFVRKREVGLPGWMNNKGALLMYNRAAQRYKQMVRLRPFLENTKVDLETAAARGEVPKTFVWQWDRYIDAVEGRSDLLTGAINQFVSDKFGAAPFWTERTYGFINGLEAAMKLGPTPISALGNLFQILINVMPVVGPEYTWKGFYGLIDPTPAAKAFREKIVTELGLKEQTSKTETFEAKNISEFIELMKPDGPADAVRGFIEGVEAASLFAFNSAEYVIRGTAALGTYKRARNEGYGHEYAMDKARRIITRTAFHLGPADKPYILRVSRAFQPLALFKSFMIKQLEFMGQVASGTGDPGARFDSRKAEIARLLAAIGIFVGIAGFPGGDNLDQIYEWFTGGGAEDVPSSLGPVRSLKENYPRISRGLPGVAADVDLTKMTGFSDWFMPQQLSLQTLGGPFASDISNLTAIMKAPEGRDKQRAIDQFWRGASPSIRRFFQAYEAHITPEHKITDTTGRVIMQDVTPWERAMILFGAMPIRMSQRYDAYEVAQRIVEKTRSLKGFYLDEGARAMEKGDSDQVNHWIQEARNQGFGDVNVPAIRRRMKYMRKDRLVQAERSVSKGAQRDELRRRREALDQ